MAAIRWMTPPRGTTLMRSKITLMTVGAFALAGCAGDPVTGTGPRENTGTLVGALTGAAVGSTIGGNAGARVAASVAGAAIGGLIGNRIGAALDGLPEGTMDVRFGGCAGPRFGALAVRGMRLTLTGEANDYVG